MFFLPSLFHILEASLTTHTYASAACTGIFDNMP